MKILKIAFCDDEPIMTKQLKDIVEEYLNQKEITAEYHIFNGGQELIQSPIYVDILFLDIDMPKIDGITAGKKYRLKNRDCKIIMATAQEEIQKEVFDVTPFHYATKPFRREEIVQCMEKAMESLQGEVGNREITVYKNRNSRIIKERQICYFKAEFGYLTVKVEGIKEYCRITSSLSKMIEEVDSRLFAIASRQYMVNLAYVTEISIDTDSILLKDETIKISKGYKKTFYEKLQEYDLNYRR